MEQDADHLFACPLLLIKCQKEDFVTTDILDKTILTRLLFGWGGGNIRIDTTRRKKESSIYMSGWNSFDFINNIF